MPWHDIWLCLDLEVSNILWLFLLLLYTCNIHLLFLYQDWVHGCRFLLRCDIPILLDHEYFVLFCPIPNLVPLLMLHYISYYVCMWLFLSIDTIVLLVTLNPFVCFLFMFSIAWMCLSVFLFSHEEYVNVSCNPHWNSLWVMS